MEKFAVNILIYLAEALSYKKKCYEDIDKVYNTNPYLFDTAFEESDYKNHPIAKQGTIIQDHYFKKMLGILLVHSVDSETVPYEKIYKMVKSGYRYPVAYLEQRTTFDFSHFVGALLKKHKGLDNISEIDLNSNLLVALSLAIDSERTNDDLFKDPLYNTFAKMLYAREQKYSVKTKEFNKETRKLIEKHRLELINRENIYIYDVLSTMKGRVDINKSGIVFDVNTVKKEERYYILVDYLFDRLFSGLDLDIELIGNEYPLSNKEIDLLIHSYLLLYYEKDTDEEIDLDDLEKYMYIAIPVLRLLKAYAAAKDYSLEKVDVAKNKEINELTKKSTEKDKEIEALKRELEQLKSANRKLTDKLEKQREDNKELHSLREYMFDNSEETDEVACEDELSKKTIQELNTIKGVIVGGFTSWQKSVKELLPSWTFISTNNYHFDTKILKNADYVFVNTTYIGHALYYKVIQNLGDSPLAYLNNKNIDLVLSEINKCMKCRLKEDV